MTLLGINGIALVCPVALMFMAGGSQAQEKITYVDHVLPLVEQHCAKCHNPDKKKGDLDLSSHTGVLKGGGTGPAVVAGNPDSSKLMKALTHAEEPTMPPNKPPLPEKELAVFRQWIAGGLLETSGSKALVAAKPKVDLTLKVSDAGRPSGPLPMPGELSIEPVVHTRRAGAVSGIAASPWAPVLAMAGQKQVLLYNSTNLDLLGILPFEDGQPLDVRFSQSGKLLLVAGGHGAQSGYVGLWNVETGERIARIGKEYDAVLTADLSADQSRIAIGGTDRLVKVYSTKSGDLEHKIKKHTDWVTAVAFSPNGEMLASADRNGGVTVWDADSGQELFTTAGHKAAVTELSWRSDSKLVASSSEDGNVTLWESGEGKQAKSWTAHKSGATSVAYSRDGRLVTCGRDGLVTTWKADGSKQVAMSFGGEMAVRCAWVDDGARVVAGDFAGNVWMWDAKTGKQIGVLDANPGAIADRIAAVKAQMLEIQSRGERPSPAALEVKKELAVAETNLGAARAESEKAEAEFAADAKEVVRLKALAAQANPPSESAAQLMAARAKREKARAWRTQSTAALEVAAAKLAGVKARSEQLNAIKDPVAEMAAAKAELEKLLRAEERSKKGEGRQEAKR